MSQDSGQRTFWTAARQGWKASIVVGLAVLLIRFKALIPLVWQMLVRNGSVHMVGRVLGDLVLVAGGLLCIYAVRTGYRRVSQALEAGGSAAGSSVALRVIGRTSLFINAPILYWALFLFVLLPQLVKIPNASLRIGTTAALAGAFLSMAVIVVLAAHIGLLLVKFSFKSLVRAEHAVTPAMPTQPLPYAQQGAYTPPGGYPVSPQTVTINQPNPYESQGNYYPAAPDPRSSVLPSAARPAPSQQANYPADQRTNGYQ